MSRTALYNDHVALGATIVDFSGWEMPVRYPKGTLAEHRAVREAAGIFDVSHMGRIVIRGRDAESLLDYLSTNKIAGVADGRAVYTVWADESGGCLDDLIVYKLGVQDFFVVVNASNREKDLQHLNRLAQEFEVVVEPRYEQDGILALQGPKSSVLLTELIPEVSQLKPMRVGRFSFQGTEIIVARTGYTGEKGYELIAPNALCVSLWSTLLEKGQQAGIEPIGLSARDTLRLEMGFALYGHELSHEISPLESVSAWTVKTKKDRFIGKRAIEERGGTRSTCGIVVEGKGIPRQGYRVLKNGTPIGLVTSGNYSPTLEKAIALILVDGRLEEGEQVDIEIRKRTEPATVVALPFLGRRAKC